jgi:hypothetical protein
MFHYFNAITNTKGDALIGYYAKAVDTTTGSVVDIFADGNSTPIVSVSEVANAAKVDENGNASFWIAGGEYHLDIYATDAVTLIERVEFVPMSSGTDVREDILTGNLANLPFTPEGYGSVGDGVTNDYAAVQAAIDAAVAAGGGTVQLGAKTYLCNTALTWTGAAVELRGSGSGVQPTGGTILKFPTGLSGAVNPKNGAGGLGAGSSIRNLRIMGSASTATVTITIASPGVVTWTAHGFIANTPIVFNTTGALPTGLAAGTTYFVRNVATNTFEVSATSGGASINTTGSQSGVHTGGSTVTDANGILGVGCGILLQANNAHVEDVTVQGFEGNGLYILSGVGVADGTINANNCRIDKVTCYGNLKNGFAAYGTDSNTCLITKLDASSNSQAGVFENSSLGNIYINPHFAGNGSDVPILVGSTGGYNRFLECYREIHPTSTLLFRTTTGGSGQNKITFHQAAGSVALPSTFTVDDQVATTEWSVQNVARVGRFGGDGTTGTTVVTDGLLLMRHGAQMQFQDNPATTNWFITPSGGNLLVNTASSGVGFYVQVGGANIANVQTDGFHVTGLGAFSGALTASNLSGTNTGDQYTSLTGLSVVGRSANSSGAAAAITGTDGQVLRVSGTTLGFGSIAAAAMPALTGDVTTSAGAVATTIANDAVTYAKMQNAAAGNVVLTRANSASGDYGETALAASQLLGRGSSGDIAAITLSGLTMSGTTLAPTGWALLGTGQTATGVWDQAVDGNKATIDFAGLAGATEIMIVGRLVTQSVLGVPFVRVSTDNGSSYYAGASDYQSVPTTGIEANSSGSNALIDTTATAARSFSATVFGANATPPKLILPTVNRTASSVFFTASTSAVNAIRLVTSGGGNFNGGKVYCLVR